MKLQSVAQTKNISDNKWLGTWERQDHNNQGTLIIKSVKNHFVEFELFAVSGANDGSIEGKAKIDNSIATFYQSDDTEPCLINFKLLTEKVISIEQKKGNCQTGLNVTYTGEYKNDKYFTKVKEKITLKKLGIFETKSEDTAFETLVGKSYSLFVNSTQIQYEETDLDKLNAKVTSSSVRGLYTIMENIIMIDPLKNIWAAVIDDNKVYYFTNRADYKTKLPLTIENWRSRFKDYHVIYK
ncbi:hypothetical protein [Flectobacillus roseus]|uniref:hypothetical protein n=1 Tax=Flectobacillus roseus TaxID=502259 RepID=UPI0024B702CC|nr:hypothetical protein [Flectobacillus roseus]MDI9868958.1 hypothetical protein [Flectobacillus roseus]